MLTELCTVGLLTVDDFALEPETLDESGDVEEFFVERRGSASALVTGNRDTSEQRATFDDVVLGQTAVDRCAHAAYDLIVEGGSYRDELHPNARASDPPPPPANTNS